MGRCLPDQGALRIERKSVYIPTGFEDVQEGAFHTKASSRYMVLINIPAPFPA